MGAAGAPVVAGGVAGGEVVEPPEAGPLGAVLVVTGPPVGAGVAGAGAGVAGGVAGVGVTGAGGAGGRTLS